MSQLHKLKLHEKINNADNDSHFMIMRVPGGWIYRFFELHQESGGDGQWSENYIADSVFVPFNGEFNINAEMPK
jgi:hypothetical protein